MGAFLLFLANFSAIAFGAKIVFLLGGNRSCCNGTSPERGCAATLRRACEIRSENAAHANSRGPAQVERRVGETVEVTQSGLVGEAGSKG